MCDNGCEGAHLITNRIVKFVATGGYVGFLPIAPGTWGSLVGLGLFLLLAPLPLLLYSIVFVSLIAIGVWVAGEAERLLGQKDASPIVIDEIAGMLLTYLALPSAWVPVLSGFIFFRIFDILKPIPQLERLPGGWGIMLDDLCAGVLAHFCVRLVILLV
jgi:phosphatidylglycerophosphatase A